MRLFLRDVLKFQYIARIMTTFKEGPVYAELLFTFLDLTRFVDRMPTIANVLSLVGWRFKGGCMTSVAGTSGLLHSGTYYVDCTSQDLATWFRDELSVVKVPDPLFTRDAASLRGILAARVARIRVSQLRSDMANYVSLAFSDGRATYPGSVVTGLTGVYKVLNDVFLTLSVPDPNFSSVSSRRMFAYIRELVHANAAVAQVDVPTAARNYDSVLTALGKTPFARIWELRSQLSSLIKLAAGKDSRKFYSLRGRLLLDGERWPEVHDEMWSSRFVVHWAGRRVLIGYKLLTFVFGEKYIAMPKSDYGRLYGVLTSVVSCMMAAASQSVTGRDEERVAGLRLPAAMWSVMATIVGYAVTLPPGDEVLACKGFKKAFTVHMGTISGPLCANETQILYAEALEALGDRKDMLDEYLRLVRSFPGGLAFDVGKAYKICPAPDSAPGGTIIDRMKTTVTPNRTDPAMLLMLEDTLRDQVAYCRALSRSDLRLEMKPGVPVPGWFAEYRRGKFDVVPMDGIRNILAWEGTGVMERRDALDPSVWKDSGLAADNLALGISDTLPKWKRNMLMRMIFDKNCPMPGNEEDLYLEEAVNKTDGKPESHKDPYRSIFSACLVTRFKKSIMEKSVGEVSQNNPTNMIGATTSKKLERIRAATSLMCTAPGLTTPFYYSFDVKGWSPLQPASVQQMSHRVWGELFPTTLFAESTRLMQGATVYVCSKGYTGWYINTESNFEGYDGKELTALNSSMLALSVKRWRVDPGVVAIATPAERSTFSALLLAYIDDGMARVELPYETVRSAQLFEIFKNVCRETFLGCGFVIEVSKCFPSDVFFIFLNEAFLAGRHLVHGVRAAGQICATLEEEHDSLVGMSDKIAGGVRGAVMAGLDAFAGITLMGLHMYDTIDRWVGAFDPVSMAVWTLGARGWGCLGMPNAMQLATTASGNAHPEAIATFQAWARISAPARKFYLNIMRTPLKIRKPVAILMAPFSIRVQKGYMAEGGIAKRISKKLEAMADDDKLGPLPMQFFRFGDYGNFSAYADQVVTGEPGDAIQAQLLEDLYNAHPYAIYQTFCSRIERGATVRGILGQKVLAEIVRENKASAAVSKDILLERMEYIVA